MGKIMVCNKKSAGFTLIELMITVAVIGILASVALPSYTEYIKKGKRAEARAEILKADGWLERYYTENNRFTNNTANDKNSIFESRFTTVPSSSSGSAANYDIAISVTAVAYTVTATPTGSMAGDGCGTYTKTNIGYITSGGEAKKCLR
jgi:type IV pilus assembly protein PilE